ncbi:MAG: ECF transporter S component [bacterium]|jgi:uncharacterized membrane protein
MQRNKLRELMLTSLFIALVTIATMVFKIPTFATSGYINLGDSMIFVGALLLGSRLGLLAGGFGSALADILLGYAHWAPFTLLIKGLEGLLVGYLAHKGFVSERPNLALTVLWLALGGAVMVGGYFITEVILYGYVAALAEVTGNLFQAAGSVIISLPLAIALKRANVIRHK